MEQVGPYSIFSADTLTDAYAGNTSQGILATYLPNITLSWNYTPKAAETNRYALLLIEVSLDGGTTWRPVAVKQDISTETKAYVEGTGKTSGIPLIIPGDKTSTGGTAYPGVLNLTLATDFIRFKVKEDSAGNHGVFTLDVTLSGGNA